MTLLGGEALGAQGSLLVNGLASDSSGGAHVVGTIDVAGWAGDGPGTSFGGETDGFAAHVLGVLPTGGTGSLQVTVEPSAARDAGAAWRLLHHDAWRASGETLASLAPGYYIVEFKLVGGWKAPAPRRVVISSNEQTSVQAVYETLALDWSSYLGGSGADDARGVAVDSSGNTYVVGGTLSSGWVAGGFDTTRSQRDGYVVKLSPHGAHLWSTYLGGASYDEARAAAIDPANGALYVAGMTASPGWVSGGWNTTHNAGVSGSGAEDGFVVKLSPTGAHLWSTYLGGNSMDSANAIVVGDDGAVYVAGAGSPGNWGAPTSGSGRIFVSRLDASGRHHWTTFFGGAQAPWTDGANGLAVDASGVLYVTGTTGAPGWTAGGYLTTMPSAQAGFLIRLNVGTGAPDWSTYIGSWVAKHGVAIGPDGAPHVIGTAMAGTAWPGKLNGADKTNSESVQVVKFSPDGTPQWGRLLGDTSLLNDRGFGIAVNDTGAVYIVGSGTSASLATPEVGSVHRGGQDAFVAKLSRQGRALWWTWGGGPGEDAARAVALGPDGGVHVVGETSSPDWMFGGWDVTYGGAGDGFVLKMRDTVGTSASVRVTIEPAAAVAAGARWRLASDGIWRTSGERIDGMVPGPHRIEFDAVAGWIRPVSVAMDLDHGEAFDLTADYAPASGTVGHGWVID